jgi:hypothetical protein
MQGAVAAALAADAANMALLTSDELKKKKRRVRTKAKPKPTLIVDNTKTPTGK